MSCPLIWCVPDTIITQVTGSLSFDRTNLASGRRWTNALHTRRAYLIVNFDVDDAGAYKQYQKGAVPSLGIGGTAKVVAYDTETKQIEGEHAGHQTVVLEYPTMEEAIAAYVSEAYQAVLPPRFAATSKHFGLIVKGA